MPERTIHTLSEVILYIKGVIDAGLAHKRFWLKAELSNINIHRSGHCYIDLVENEEGRTLAQCRANIWKPQLKAIKEDLAEDFSNIMKKGAEILCVGEVVFDPVYGLSINISRVDKSFALGELERKKQETLKKLQELNLLDKNKRHVLPVVIQKVAVVGSAGTSGHTDFMKMLQNNEHGFDFDIRTYSCAVQGDQVADEIIQRLESLQLEKCDAIVLIRGGGSKLDLEVFNSFELAKTIATHALPILTGIGHETDVSVADVVANQHFKTPSAVGSFIVDRAYQFDVRVSTAYHHIRKVYEQFMARQQHRLEQNAHTFRSESTSYTRLRRGELHMMANRIISGTRALLSDENEILKMAREQVATRPAYRFESERRNIKNLWQVSTLGISHKLKGGISETLHRKEMLASLAVQLLRREKENLRKILGMADLYHPERTLERGYALARKDGHVIDKDTNLEKGDELEIELHDRKIIATFVEETKKWKDLLTKALQKN